MPPKLATYNDSLSQRVSAGLAKIGIVMKSRAWKTGHENRLTPTQAQILSFLHTSQGGGQRLSSVAAALAITKPTASTALATLVGKGLVRKERADDDARAIALRLTRRGKKAAETASQWPDFLNRAVDCLSNHEQEVLLRSLVKMIYTLQRRGEITVSRMCVGCQYFQPMVHDDPIAPHHCRFVDAPLGERDFRLDCPDHDEAPPEVRDAHWAAFSKHTNDLHPTNTV